jgi:multidrug efflux pump subunit AcrA (membrane-fusion protein)
MKNAISRSLPQIIILIVIVAVGTSIVFNQLGISFASKSPSARTGAQAKPAAPGQSAKAPNGGKRTIAVRASAIRSGVVSNYTKIHGDVVSNNEIKIYPNVGGKLLERKVSVGDQVIKGTIIALVDPSKVGETYMPNPVESTVFGTVLSIPVHPGDTIASNTVIATVGNLSRTEISAAVPERYLTHLRNGTSAEISFDAIPGSGFSAKITEMSPVVDTTSRTLGIKLQLEKADPRILVGMFATVKLATETRQNVIVAPRASVILGSEEAYVFVVKGDNTVERRQVSLGLEGEESFEVKKGLTAGELVVTEGKGSIANGDSVKVVNGKAGSGAAAAQ